AAGAGVDRDDRRREQVVAGADRAVVVGARVAGREIDEAELGIDGRRLPDRRAAVHPDVVVLRPGLVAGLAGAGDRVERPDETAVVRVVGLHAAANAALGAGEAGDHEAVVVELGASDAVALLPALGLHGPEDAAVALIERDELAVELADEDFAVAQADAAARPAAADRVDRRIE